MAAAFRISFGSLGILLIGGCDCLVCSGSAVLFRK